MSQQEVGLRYGFRSGLEEKIALALTGRGVPFDFEKHKLSYTQPAKERKYLPDFRIEHKTDPTRVLWIESKGRFMTEDRAKHRLVKETYPELDLRFVFSNSKQRISKQSLTTYASFCDRMGWLYADKAIPEEWLKEYGY